MRKTKRFLILIFAFALALSLTAVTAFADGGAAPTDSEIGDLIRIYSEDVYYAEDFEEDGSIRTLSSLVDNGGAAEGVVTVGGNRVLKLVGAPSENEDVYLDASSAGDAAGFVFETRIAANGGVFNVYVSGKNEIGESFSSMLLLSLDFTGGSVVAHRSGAYGMPVTEELDGVSLVPGAWYSVSVIYTAKTASYKLSITQTTSASGETLATPVSITAELSGILTSLTGAKVALAGATIDNRTVYLDDVYLYRGTAHVDYEAVEEKVGAAVASLVERLEDSTDEAERISLIEKLEFFVLHGDARSAEYAEAVKYSRLRIVEYYVNEYAKLVKSYNRGDKYVERVLKIELMDIAKAQIPEAPVYSADDEIYELAASVERTLVSMENAHSLHKTELQRRASESERFIEYMSDKKTRNNCYEEIEEWVRVAGAFGFDPTYYNESDGEVKDITDFYNAYVILLGKVLSQKNDHEAFIRYVDEMEAAATFTELYAAYLGASDIRFFDVRYTYYVMSENASGEQVKIYPMRDTLDADGSVVAKGYLTRYNEIARAVQTTEKACVNFIACIADAKTATNLSALNVALGKAELYDMADNNSALIALEFEYPGVTEAVAEYAALIAKRNAEAELARAFVAAVELVRGAKDKATVKELMTAAAQKRPEGILDGYEGYSEALVYYAEIEATYLYGERIAAEFIALVNELSAAVGYREKYDLIKAAKECLPRLDYSMDGVLAAKALLDANISLYNSAAEKSNEEFTQTVATSAKIASTPSPTDAFLRVVAIIKKIFE